MVETRCYSGGIEHAFINYLIYSDKLRSVMKIKRFHHGQGLMNSLGGLKPNTVTSPHLSGDLVKFWKLFNNQGKIIQWSGEVSVCRLLCASFLYYFSYCSS
jgi:hypothetical protein